MTTYLVISVLRPSWFTEILAIGLQLSILGQEINIIIFTFAEYAMVPVLAKYAPGEPTARLYIKNVAKSVTERHLRHIYDRWAYGHYGPDATAESIVADPSL